MGSPPPEGSKKKVFKFRSVNNIVIAPARTERDRSRRIAVMRIDQTKRGILSRDIDFRCIFKIVEIKLIAPRIEDISAIWRKKMIRSTEGPLWNIWDDNGGYRVLLAPVPMYKKFLKIRRVNEGDKSQNLILFICG